MRLGITEKGMKRAFSTPLPAFNGANDMVRRTKFSDMPSGSVKGWVAWANQHDWGAGPNAPAYYDDATGELVTFGGEYDGYCDGAWKIRRAGQLWQATKIDGKDMFRARTLGGIGNGLDQRANIAVGKALFR